jgi:MazG family protein
MAYSFDDLVQIMARLRAPEGCPWDREQTHETLLKYLIEESTEVIEAVQSGNKPHVCEELGDVLLQVVFHAQIATENGHFTSADVIDGIATKLVRRHPHVFLNATADTPEQVMVLWDKIKAEERANQPKASSVLDKVSRSLPSLARAQELQAKAAKVGFDWTDVKDVLDKIREEILELEVEIRAGDKVKFEDEFGDLLFALVNLARHAGVEAELAMIRANQKFDRRFRRVETLSGGGEVMKTMTLAQMDLFWDQAKREEKGKVES